MNDRPHLVEKESSGKQPFRGSSAAKKTLRRELFPCLVVVIVLSAFVQSGFGQDSLTNVMSAIVSYQYPNNLDDEVLATGGALSPFASFRYEESFGDQTLTNGGISSAFVSYQFQNDLGGEILTNGGIESPLLSYSYPNEINLEILTNGGSVSPVVSYRFLQNFQSEVFNSGGVVSPFVSYQYFESGNGILNSQNSPQVSYYYQSGNAQASAFVHGRITDQNGVPIAGVTVSAMVYLTPTAQAATDLDGNYQLPSLGTGVYDLWVVKASFQTSIRAFALDATTVEQDFQLKLAPPVPSAKVVNRSASVNYTVGDIMGSQLRIFDGAAFVPITANNWPSPSLKTIVMTHGWVRTTPDQSVMNTPFDRWPVNMAAKLQLRGITPGNANIVAWDWRYAAMATLLNVGVPADRTSEQGAALGEALQYFLGSNYSQPLHFLGHSLGTLVNASAIDYLHGEKLGIAGYSPTPWMQNIVHVTTALTPGRSTSKRFPKS